MTTIHSYIECNYPGVIYASESLETAQQKREIALREGYNPTEVFSSPEGNLIMEPDDDWKVVWMRVRGE